MVKESKNKTKFKKKCIVCKKKLKITETNLCSCKTNVCMKHRDRSSHKCQLDMNMDKMDQIVPLKINKI